MIDQDLDLFKVRPALNLNAIEALAVCRYQLPMLFDDPICLTDDARRARVRAFVITRDLEHAVAGKFVGTEKVETWGQLYERLYGQKLHYDKGVGNGNERRGINRS